VSTPLRRQYLDIKRRYPHALLFFRLGDFYETFDSDAETVARELEITLTSRPVSKGERVPLAGVPHHSLETHLAKLIAKGYKVAICEQTEPPKKSGKIVDRKVVRVVTPGTLVEDNLLDAGKNNYLATLVRESGGALGLAYLDLSTAEFACLQGPADAITAETRRLRPAELLLGPGVESPADLGATLTPLTAAAADPEAAIATLMAQFEASSLDSLGLGAHRLAAAAAGAAIGYVRDNAPVTAGRVTGIRLDLPGGHMLLDDNTRRNLELHEPLRGQASEGPDTSLLALLDETKTPMGARLLRRWLIQPLLDPGAINARLDAVQIFHDSAVRRGRARELLSRVPDIERALTRVMTAAAGSPGPNTTRDLLGIRRGLDAVPAVKRLLSEASDPSTEHLNESLRECATSAALIAAAIAEDGGVIRPGFSPELDELSSSAGSARQYVAELERRERERTGIKSLKVGYNRVFGYYIEVSKANAASVPDGYLRKQTLVGGERYTIPELQEQEYRVLHAEELRAELEDRLLLQVCAQVASDSRGIQDAASGIARIDAASALAEVASSRGYVRPEIDDSDAIVIKDGRHPVVEVTTGNTYVPNDIYLSSSDAQVILLTGPNMAGKSTYLRQAALIVIMAQAGSFVPASEARIGVVDRVFSRVGALDDIGAGRSTFMAEMLETAAMLRGATPRSLLVFDEIGRGTSTYDGMAIARAVVEYVHNRPDTASRTLFATHYHELTAMASTLPRIRNFNIAVAEEGGDVVFLHRITPGGADRSYGVHVARLAGLPRAVTTRAAEILTALEYAPHRTESPSPAPQLPLVPAPADGLHDEIAGLDPDSMTPLDALRTLYDLTSKARNASA
jgi:DNA mismatch repair protein MutS